MKALSNVSKLKINSEALTKIELKVIRELYIAKSIIANNANIITYSLDIGMRMNQENGGKTVFPTEGKKFYPVALQVVKNTVNTSAMFVENVFK